jgi:general secretion pathway protein K
VVNGATRMRGAALLLVLWLIVLLTGLVGSFALAARVENIQGHVLARGLVAQNAARAGVEYALTRIQLTDPRLQWLPNGQPHQWRYGGAEVEIRIVDENGKVDLNQAAAPLLAALLAALEVEPAQAQRLAAAIVDWRDSDPLTQAAGGAEDGDYASAGLPYGAKDAPFEGIAELEQVLGFTPELYDEIAPYVTVYSGLAQPVPQFAAAPVLDALGLDGAAIVEQRGQLDPVTGLPPAGAGGVPGGLGLGGGSGTYSIDSRARLADGREARLRVVLRMGGGMPGSPYTALRWQEGASSR